MSLRAVKSPLAPKMTIVHDSSALRSEPMWQGEESSGGIELFTRQPWRNRRPISTLLVLEFKLQLVLEPRLQPELQPNSACHCAQPDDNLQSCFRTSLFSGLTRPSQTPRTNCSRGRTNCLKASPACY